MKKVFAFSAMALALSLVSCGNTGVNVGSGGDSSSGGGGSGGGSTQTQPANAIVITLRSWETVYSEKLGGKPDPTVYFRVNGVRGGSVVSSNTTENLLNKTDISSWSGTSKSLPVRFSMDSDSIRIDAIVIEKDLLADDDWSPGYFTRIRRPLNVGRTGSVTLDYGSGKSAVRFDYELVNW